LFLPEISIAELHASYNAHTGLCITRYLAIWQLASAISPHVLVTELISANDYVKLTLQKLLVLVLACPIMISLRKFER